MGLSREHASPKAPSSLCDSWCAREVSLTPSLSLELSETDYAMVVTFDTEADSQSTHLLQCVTLCLPERVMRF